MVSILKKLKQKRDPIYTDFDVSFSTNPITGDIMMNYDEKVISQSLKFLVLTNLFERPFQPELGSDIRSSLFGPITPAVITFIKEKVKDLVLNYETRVELIDVDVISLGHTIQISVYYTIRNKENTLQTTIYVERDR